MDRGDAVGLAGAALLCGGVVWQFGPAWALMLAGVAMTAAWVAREFLAGGR